MMRLQNGMAEQRLDKLPEWRNLSCTVLGRELAYGCKQVGKVGQAAA